MTTDAAQTTSRAAHAAQRAGEPPALRTRFAKRKALQPIYSGGAFAVDASGQWLVTTLEQTAVISSVETGRVAARIPGDTEEITSLSLTPDATRLAVASRSLGIRIYSLQLPRQGQRTNGVASSSAAAAASTSADSATAVTFKLERNLVRAHDAPVAIMRVDPTSTLLATGAADGAVKVWDLDAGYCTHVFRGHGGIVSSLAWHMTGVAAAEGKPNSARNADTTTTTTARRRIELFTGAIDGRVRQWDLLATPGTAGHKPLSVLPAHVSVVRGLCVSDDGDTLVSAARDRTLVVWRRRAEKKQHEANRRQPQQQPRSRPDVGWTAGETIVTGEGIESAGFLRPDAEGRQDLFYTGGSEGEVRLWRASTSRVESLQPGGRWMAGVAGKTLQDGDADPEETRAIVDCHYLAEQDCIVSAHADQNLVFHSAPPDPRDGSVELVRRRQIVGFNDEVVDVCLLSPGLEGGDAHPPGAAPPPGAPPLRETHLAVATNSTAIKVYDLRNDGHDVEMLPSDAANGHGHTALVLSLDRSPDGRWLASSAKDRTARIWARVRTRWVAAAPNGASDGLGHDHDDLGKSAAKCGARNGGDGDKKDGYEWRCVAVAEGHAESVGALAFARRSASPGAPFLVTASQDRTAKVWDLFPLSEALASGEWRSDRPPLKLKSLSTLKVHDKDVNSVDVSPNNALLVSASQDRTAKVWSINYVAPSKANGMRAQATLRAVATCKGHKRSVWSARFSPADAAFVTASADRSARMWSLRDFGCVKTFEGHANGVLRADFLGARGTQLVTSASDGLVKVWNVRDEACVDTLDGHDERVWGLALRGDCSEIISAGADSRICFWEDRTERDQVEQAREREAMVEREQRFANLLTLKDYRNAISLALAMDQPRRLLNLFTAVHNSRPEGEAARSANELLSAASRRRTAGEAAIVSAAAARSGKKQGGGGGLAGASTAPGATPTSITGLAAVDEVVAGLSDEQIVRLLAYVRDWNTTARTSNVAQVVLHALLRLHPAERLLDAFDGRRGRAGRRGGGAGVGSGREGLEEEEAGEGEEVGDEGAQRRRRRGGGAEKPPELEALLEALLSYTERHYARADRMVMESAMLDLTLAQMDAVLGPEEEAGAEGEEPPSESDDDDDDDSNGDEWEAARDEGAAGMEGDSDREARSGQADSDGDDDEDME